MLLGSIRSAGAALEDADHHYWASKKIEIWPISILLNISNLWFTKMQGQVHLNHLTYEMLEEIFEKVL